MKKVLFYPVTCNPPHFGHVAVVKAALSKLSFDEVWILPSGKRVDKEISTSYEDIKNLANLFVKYLQTEVAVPVKIITDAIDNVNTKYTHEVIMELKLESEDEIFQLCGSDGYTSIKERVIAPHERFVIVKRAGYELPEGLDSNSNLVVLDEEIPGISSTQIREMVKNGDQTYIKLVPEKIASYIQEKGLYI